MTQPEQEAREMLAACPNPDCGSDKIDIKAEPRLDGSMQGISECWDCGVRGPSTPHYVGPSRDKNTAAAKRGAAEMWNAFAARQTAGIDRDVVARIIEPEAWAYRDDCMQHPERFEEIRVSWPNMSHEQWANRGPRIAGSLAKADAILALLPTPAKTGERGAIIEECLAAVRAVVRQQDADHGAANSGGAEAALEAIRALSQPLPDAPIVGGEPKL